MMKRAFFLMAALAALMLCGSGCMTIGKGIVGTTFRIINIPIKILTPGSSHLDDENRPPGYAEGFAMHSEDGEEFTGVLWCEPPARGGASCKHGAR